MIKTIQLFSILIVLYSCGHSNTTPKENNSNKEEVLNADLIQTFTVPQLGCYYELDDKYSHSNDTGEISKWWDEKLEFIKASGIQNDVFSNSGGPNGSVWNSYTDLYFVTLFQTGSDSGNPLDTILVKINDSTVVIDNIKKLFFGKNNALIGFKIDKELWFNNLRAIEKKDYTPLYGKERLERARKGEAVFIADLDTGEVFKITVEITLKNHEVVELSKYFHITFADC